MTKWAARAAPLATRCALLATRRSRERALPCSAARYVLLHCSLSSLYFSLTEFSLANVRTLHSFSMRTLHSVFVPQYAHPPKPRQYEETSRPAAAAPSEGSKRSYGRSRRMK